MLDLAFALEWDLGYLLKLNAILLAEHSERERHHVSKLFARSSRLEDNCKHERQNKVLITLPRRVPSASHSL